MDPNFNAEVRDAECDLFWGRAMVAGGVLLIVVLLFVPRREGASASGMIFLFGIAGTLLGKGIVQASSAKRVLEAKRK